MILRHIYVYLNRDEFPQEAATSFGFRTRYLCNFVERTLRGIRFKTKGFSKVCVQGCREAVESCPIVPVNAALPSVLFNQREYESLAPQGRHEFFIAMLLEGLEKCSRFHDVPLQEIRACIDAFRRDGYRNEWTHQRKVLRPIGLQASLLCDLNEERFVLTLKLERGGTTIFQEAILQTKPDEIVFAHRLKDVVMDGRAIVVRDKFGKSTFSMDAMSLH